MSMRHSMAVAMQHCNSMHFVPQRTYVANPSCKKAEVLRRDILCSACVGSANLSHQSSMCIKHLLFDVCLCSDTGYCILPCCTSLPVLHDPTNLSGFVLFIIPLLSTRRLKYAVVICPLFYEQLCLVSNQVLALCCLSTGHTCL